MATCTPTPRKAPAVLRGRVCYLRFEEGPCAGAVDPDVDERDLDRTNITAPHVAEEFASDAGDGSAQEKAEHALRCTAKTHGKAVQDDLTLTPC